MEHVDIYYPAIHNPPYSVRVTDTETGMVVTEHGEQGEPMLVIKRRALNEMERRRNDLRPPKTV